MSVKKELRYAIRWVEGGIGNEKEAVDKQQEGAQFWESGTGEESKYS